VAQRQSWAALAHAARGEARTVLYWHTLSTSPLEPLLGADDVTSPLPPRLARELDRTGCVEVAQVVDDAPAARAGVRPGDLIVAIDGRPVETMAELQRLLVGERIGASVTFTVARHERVLDVVVVPLELAA